MLEQIRFDGYNQLMLNRSVSNVLICLLFLSLCAAAPVPEYCSAAFSQAQQQQEQIANTRNMQWLGQTLQEQPRFFSAIFGKLEDKGLIYILIETTFSLFALNRIYFLTAFTIIFVFYFLGIKDKGLQQTAILRSFNLLKSQLHAFVAIFVLILCGLLIFYSIQGINNSDKQLKAINQMLCQFSEQPKKIPLQLTDRPLPKQGDLQNFIESHSTSIFFYETMEGNKLMMKLKYSEFPLKASQTIINALSEEHYSGQLLQEVKDAKQFLSFIMNFRNLSANFDQCKQYTAQFLYQVLQKSYYIERSIDYVTKDNIRNFSIEGLVQDGITFGKLYYLAIIICVIALAISILINRRASAWIKNTIIVFAILCFLALMVTTLALCVGFWATNTFQYVNQSDNHFIEEYKSILSEQNFPIYAILGPVDIKNASIANPYSYELCYDYYNKYEAAAKPYYRKQQSYFYDLLSQSATEVKDEQKRNEILKSLQDKNMKVPLIPLIQDMHKHLKYFIDIEGKIDIKPYALKQYISSVTKTVSVHAINQLANIRQVCGPLLVLLILLLLPFGQLDGPQAHLRQQNFSFEMISVAGSPSDANEKDLFIHNQQSS